MLMSFQTVSSINYDITRAHRTNTACPKTTHSEFRPPNAWFRPSYSNVFIFVKLTYCTSEFAPFHTGQSALTVQFWSCDSLKYMCGLQ